MKIGAFASKYNVEISTLRHYIDMGLLLPQKQGSQYSFHKSDSDDMECILELKATGFQLKEILNVMNIQRSYNPGDSTRYDKLSEALAKKKCSLMQEIKEKQEGIKKINLKSREFELSKANIKHISNENTFLYGVPLVLIPLLKCAVCQNYLSLNSAAIERNTCISGNLECRCGYHAVIKNGIIFSDIHTNLDLNKDFVFNYFGDHINPLSYRSILHEFIPEVNSEYLTFQHKARTWIDEKLCEKNIDAKVVLFLDLSSHFLYHYSNQAYFKDSLVIVVGISENSIIPIRRQLQELNPDLKIAYMISPDLKLPLAEESVDLMIDHNGLYNLSFFLETSALGRVLHHFKKHCSIVGSYDYYNPDSKTLSNIKKLYCCAMKDGQTLKALQNILMKSGFKIEEELTLGTLKSPGFYFEYHEPGEFRGNYVYSCSGI